MKERLTKRLPFLFGDHHKAKVLRQVLSIIFTTFISQLLLQWFQNDLRMDLVINFTFLWHTEKFFLSWMVLMVPALWLWALLNNAKVVNLIMIGSSALTGFITYEKMSQRDEPLYPADFKMIFEVDFLLKMLPPIVVLLLLGVIVLIVIWLVWLFRKEHVKIGILSRILLLGTTSVGLYYLFQFQEVGNLVKRAYDRTATWIPYSQKMNYYNTGFVAGFLYNLPSDPMVKPVGMDTTELEALFLKYQKKAEKINATRKNANVDANIIYIMNESFADPLSLDRADASFDPIPFTRQLANQTRSGSMLSQGYGGGTANIEFEALTGYSMEPFAANISTPFTQFLPKMSSFPSIVSRLKEEGHYPFAIHPFDTSMYKRRDNYKMLGFEAFYYDETMVNTGRIGTNPYISDDAAYKEIVERMQESESYDFVHLVTMQNHSPFQGKYETFPNHLNTGFVKEEINQYHQALIESDHALEKLFTAIQEMDEPVVVVFWGDHWPSIFDESFKQQSGDLLSRTPVIVFGNELSEQKKWDIISPIYFMTELWEATDTKITPFDALMMTMRNEVPAFEKGMYYLPDGSFVQTREELPVSSQAILKEYDWVMYDTTTGSRQLEKMGFFTLGD